MANMTRREVLGYGIPTIIGGVLIGKLIKLELDSHYKSPEQIQIDVNDKRYDQILNEGIQQIVDVPGEDFQLMIDYHAELEEGTKWNITSNKDITTDICTLGLDNNKEVLINKIHIKSIIKSTTEVVDGIKQADFEERFDNKSLMGYSISDEVTNTNVSHIDGQNLEFLEQIKQAFSYDGYSNHDYRYKEYDYLIEDVYSNIIKFDITIVIKNEDGTARLVEVPTSIEMPIWPFCKRDDKYIYFEMMDGSYREIQLTEEDYQEVMNQEKVYTKSR